MKKALKWIALTPVFLICGILAILLIILLIGVLWNGVFEIQEIPYYKNVDHYVTAQVQVDSIEYDEEKEIIYLELTDLLESGIQRHWYYYLNKENTKIALNNGMLEKIHPKDIITIRVAPRVFGDGYVIPLASVSNDDEALLPFDIGWENLKKDH